MVFGFWHAKVKGKCLMDVPKGWWSGNGIRDAKAESLRLARSMVGILTDYDDLCCGERRECECSQLEARWRVDSAGCTLRGEASDKGLACIRCEHRCQDCMPV